MNNDRNPTTDHPFAADKPAQTAATPVIADRPPTGTAPAPTTATAENPDRDYLVALLLSYFLGSIGADRFYLGRTGTAIAKLLTFGGLGIWALIDLYLITFNKLKVKGDDRPLQGYAKNIAWTKPVAIVLVVMNILVLVGFFLMVILSAAGDINDRAQDLDRGIERTPNSEPRFRGSVQ